MVHVKICGIRRAEDAETAVEAGASALGFNFWTGTPRYISPSDAAGIIAAVPAGIWAVGVFVDEAPQHVLEIAEKTGVSMLQLHGNESPEYLDRLAGYPIIKAMRVGQAFDVEQLSRFHSASAFLLDCHVPGMVGGTGRAFDWSLAVKAKPYGKLMLAGGLRPENVAEAVRTVHPWAVDVCTGVESEPGKKDGRLVREFVRSVRSADSEDSEDSEDSADRNPQERNR